ncbi:hypothetical protein COY28_01125 [Candidatus Woesearchaeota archaeon CG_4_10_14_0_2_um_filter_57_5]|nr:MAG: hypothetical protein COV94_01550 [Candidatus Woesearchaeota archaeon CG11_big_fil_rev_8_21_14_0_20_57_5]PIZ56233.1 MAG: hypothetical protein COY28_01125 [Candidatus Woesearchaeota archaeon CG_4_10_14_0_2_um_filter_57_5]
MSEPNGNLADAYVKKAEEALFALGELTVPSWQIAAAYYAMYFSLYAVLVRIGIRSEIHACTLACARV